MLKILVLEDKPEERDRLLACLSRYAQENPGFQYLTTCYDRGIDLLEHYRRDADLIFLDIRLPDMLGIDVARRLRETDENVLLIFVTSLTQYAIEGYSVSAFDYILKPLHYPSFAGKLRRVLRVLSHRLSETVIELRDREGSRRLSADSVTYIESSGHDLLFHTGDEAIPQWGTLTKYEEQLREAHFFRCHTSFLVNLKYVQGVRKDEVTVAGATLPISRPKRKDFLTALAQYQGGTR